MNKEIWKDIPDYEGRYQVSNLGAVRSLNYMHTGTTKIIHHKINKYGYVTVCLHKNTVRSHRGVHGLVLRAFVGEPNGLVPDHINRVRTDNRLDNLRYCTQRENQHNTNKDNKTSKYFGVDFYKPRNMWRSRITHNKKCILLGLFEDEHKAAEAFKIALEYVKLNDKLPA